MGAFARRTSGMSAYSSTVTPQRLQIQVDGLSLYRTFEIILRVPAPYLWFARFTAKLDSGTY
jgi:hypothetical protein